MKAYSQKILPFLLFCFTLLLNSCARTSFSNSSSSLPLHQGPVMSEQHIPTAHPPKVTVLLPLTGALSGPAQAIRDGFLTAYYQAKEANSTHLPTIQFLDTAKSNITALYQKAAQEGADFIVGPLDKSEVSELALSGSLPIPTLALNSLDNTRRAVPNLYQFGLNPTDEAVQAALKASSDNHSRAIVIAPKTARGQRLVKAFSEQWQAQGGKIVDQLYYSNQANLSDELQQLLNIDKSTQRKTYLAKALSQKIQFSPRRRTDVDAVFLVGAPSAAQQIKPLLNFYFAGDLPVYSTSDLNTGHLGQNQDLEGILFCDVPWVLEPKLYPPSLNEIRAHIKNLWPNRATKYAKFFALGVDAFHLLPLLYPQPQFYGYGKPSATGVLYLNSKHQFYRHLMWTKIADGQLHNQ